MDDIKALREQLAQALQRENELALRVADLTDFVEHASIPLHWVDSKGIIIWANQAELDLLGYTKDEYIGQSITNFHSDQLIIQDILTRLANHETIRNYPARLTSKDGSIRHVLINSNVRRENGEFIHTRCFTRDVTAFIKEEERMANILVELEQSEARLRMAMESTHMGTWEYHPISGKLSWSKECRKIYGIPAEAAVSFSVFSDHIHAADKELVEQEIQNAMKPGGAGLYDITFRISRFDDHSMRWIRAQGKVYFNDSGQQAERFIGTVIDITENKLSEEKSARLVAIIESSDDVIISKTLEGIITSWNNAATRIFGYTADEMIGESILKLIPADRQEEEPRILSRLRNGERVEHFETRRVTKFGQLLDVSLTISPVYDASGKIIGLSKIARDITEKKQEEQRKNSFIAMVSHELKTPLTSMKTYIQVLLAKAKKEDDPFVINALTRADVQAQKMTTMIHDFLNLARLEEGKIPLDKETFILHALIEEIASDAQFISSSHQVQLKDCHDITLNADRNKIGQVLMNLLSNAIKYSPKGSNVIIGCEKQPGKVKIYVSDKGVGISADDQKHLFERFYRSKNEKIKTVSGFGIGLYLVSEILRYHDSKIMVESEEGAGATFYFILDTDN